MTKQGSNSPFPYIANGADERAVLHAVSAMLGIMPALVCVSDESGRVVFASQHYVSLADGVADIAEAHLESQLYSAVLYDAVRALDVGSLDDPNWEILQVQHSDGGVYQYRFCRVKITVGEKKLLLTLGVSSHDGPQLQNDLHDYKSALTHLAFRDALTGVANRTLFYDRLDKVLSSAKRNKKHVALMLVDIDHFHAFNEQYGRAVGDRYLKCVADTIGNAVRDVDTVARIGGDKFVVILDDVNTADNIEAVADKLLLASSVSLELDAGQVATCTASIGISLFPKDGRSAEKLLQHADLAVTKAKSSGKNQHAFYLKAMAKSAANYLLLENDLHGAIERDEMCLLFQPQVDARDGRIVGLEVLCRWQHPTRGVLPAAHFIPLAEESGLIEVLGAWVLQHSVAACQRWLNQGYDFGKIAVNVSAKQFRSGAFLESMPGLLSDASFPVERLELELTESTAMESAIQSAENLQALHRMGISIALDDFGTGYSSLAYLQRFPIQKLKIDKSFVDHVTRNDISAATVKSIIDLGKNMSLTVLAEGAETDDQVAWLKNNGCFLIQGTAYSGALTEAELLALADDASKTARKKNQVYFR